MHLIVLSVKFFTGAHRPHFFETCKPDRMFNCTLGSFVNEFVCTNTEESRVRILDASQSFFSGHAATCVYSCLFICWYLQTRVKNRALFMLPFVQTILIILSFYGSISRVFDHRHHWWDVLTGASVGFLACLYTVICIHYFEALSFRKKLLSFINCSPFSVAFSADLQRMQTQQRANQKLMLHFFQLKDE